MNISITHGSLRHVPACAAALHNSRLGQEYFESEERAISELTEGITKRELYVALDEAGQCLGFIWFILDAAFHGFPYLHIIAVSPASRGLGIGKQLLRFFEDSVFADNDKVFLVVADFNPDAKRLYESVGYQQVGAIPNLYRDGITEHLMMKLRPNPA